MLKAAKILRNEIFKHDVTFEYEFENNCQQKASPSKLQSFVNNVLFGITKKSTYLDQNDSCCTEKLDDINDINVSDFTPQLTLTLSQLIIFNCKSSKSKPDVNYHHRNREPPVPVGLALTIYTHTRQRNLIQIMYELGLCISYDRVLEISNCIAQYNCEKYEKENAVCPPNLVKNVFTTAAGDNIDHNPTSATANSSFHGTGISLFQHPSSDNCLVKTVLKYPSKASSKKVPELPEFFTSIQPMQKLRNNLNIPVVSGFHIGLRLLVFFF